MTRSQVFSDPKNPEPLVHHCVYIHVCMGGGGGGGGRTESKRVSLCCRMVQVNLHTSSAY